MYFSTHTIKIVIGIAAIIVFFPEKKGYSSAACLPEHTGNVTFMQPMSNVHRTSCGKEAAPQTIADITGIINIALRNNITIKDARLSVAMARKNVAEAGAGFLPYMTSQGSFTRSGTGTGTPHGTNTLGATVTSEVALFDGLLSVNRYRRSTVALAAARTSNEAAVEELIYEVVKEYLVACLDSEYTLIRRQDAENQRTLLVKIEAFKNTGQRPVSDYLSQTVYTQQAEIDCGNAEIDLVRSRYALCRLIGIDSLLPDNFFPEMPEIDTARVFSIAPPEKYTRRQIQQRYDLRRQLLATQLARLDRLIASSALYPSLSFGATLKSGYSPVRTESFTQQFAAVNLQKSLYLSLNISLFDRLTAACSVARSSLQVQRECDRFNDLEVRALMELREAGQILETQKKQYAQGVVALERALAAHDAAHQRYDAGLLTLTELFSASSLVNQMRYQNVTLLYAVILQLITIGYYSGDIQSSIAKVLP